MARREYRRLAVLLVERLKRAGFTWESLEEVPPGRLGYYWQRPSVHVPVALMGEDACLYSGIKLDAPVEEWGDVYDRYLYKLGGEPDPWPAARRLAAEMRLPFAARQRMRPRNDLPPRGAWYVPLVGYAMLVKGALREEVAITETGSSFVATHASGRQFGVAAGLPVGRRVRTARAFRLRHRSGLSRLLAPYGEQRRRPALFDRFRRWVDTHADRFTEDLAEVTQVLNVLYFAYAGVLPDQMQEMLFLSAGEELRYAVEYARRFREFRQPRAMLTEVFVPDHLSRRRFEQLFGRSGGETLPLSAARAQEWDAVLDALHGPQK